MERRRTDGYPCDFNLRRDAVADIGRFRSTYSGKRALVTGASSGIGEALARRLAAEGCSLILTARREERLTRLAKELAETHGIEADVIALDLLEAGAVLGLKQRLDEAKLVVDILINNAGFGYQGHFVDLEWDQINDLIDLDIRAMTQMAHVFAKDMIARGTRGKILNVGSIFSFGGVAQYANYSGAKGYVLNFSEALTEELKAHGIGVTMLGPGVTRTEFFDTANDGVVPKGVANFMQTPDEVAVCGIAALAKGKPVAVSGRLYQALTFMRRLVPRKLAVLFWTLPGEP
jgi:short-subunit dehydrogenase